MSTRPGEERGDEQASQRKRLTEMTTAIDKNFRNRMEALRWRKYRNINKDLQNKKNKYSINFH